MPEDNAALHLVIPGICPPAPRPRFTLIPVVKFDEILARMKRPGAGMKDVLRCFRPQVYNEKTGDYATWKRMAARVMHETRMRHFGRQPFAPAGTPLQVHFLFVLPLPKADHRTRSLPPRRWCTSKRRGDFDNLIKGPLDAATGVLWHDDSAVAAGEVEVVIGAQGEPPRTEMLLLRLFQSDAAQTRFEQHRGVFRQAGRLLDAMDQGDENRCPQMDQTALPF